MAAIRKLTGQFMAQLEWDRDTVAFPPSDLTAVHITDVNNAYKQGWDMKTDLLYKELTATASGQVKTLLVKTLLSGGC